MRCAHCGLRYEDFRTGLTYADVFAMLWVWDEDSTKWRHKGRHTVLGLWRQIKRELWAEHEACCEHAAKAA